MSALRHRHTFHALYYHLGPHGPQDVHLHPCFGREDGCQRVLVGDGRECDCEAPSHRRMTLSEHGLVARAVRRRGRWTYEPGAGWLLDGHPWLALAFDPLEGSDGAYRLEGEHDGCQHYGEAVDHFLDGAMAWTEAHADEVAARAA